MLLITARRTELADDRVLQGIPRKAHASVGWFRDVVGGEGLPRRDWGWEQTPASRLTMEGHGKPQASPSHVLHKLGEPWTRPAPCISRVRRQGKAVLLSSLNAKPLRARFVSPHGVSA